MPVHGSCSYIFCHETERPSRYHTPAQQQQQQQNTAACEKIACRPKCAPSFCPPPLLPRRHLQSSHNNNSHHHFSSPLSNPPPFFFLPVTLCAPLFNAPSVLQSTRYPAFVAFLAMVEPGSHWWMMVLLSRLVPK